MMFSINVAQKLFEISLVPHLGERMKKIWDRTFKNFIQRGRSERQEEAYPCGTLTLSSDMRTKLGKFFRVLMER
jgi:hypothetical protein